MPNCKNSLLIFSLVLAFSSLEAAPYYRSPPASRGTTVQESIGELRHDVDNHDAEIRQFEERLNTQEMVVDGLREQLKDSHEAQKELSKGSIATAEGKIVTFDAILSKAASDIQLLQAHCNESSKALSQYKFKIEELEKNMAHLQTALQSVLSAFQGEESVSTESEVRYQVKNGDSLEKIAKRHQTTIQKIKEINGLKNDRIFIGQRLKLK